MKLNTRNIARKSGMTLLELTVVILVLLSLISILFVGARAWKKGSDRAGCILNIRNVQQAVRGHQNMYNLNVGASLPTSVIYTDTAGEGNVNNTAAGYLKTPVCPSNGTYTPTTTVPEVGILYITCSRSATTDLGHAPTEHTQW